MQHVRKSTWFAEINTRLPVSGGMFTDTLCPGQHVLGCRKKTNVYLAYPQAAATVTETHSYTTIIKAISHLYTLSQFILNEAFA